MTSTPLSSMSPGPPGPPQPTRLIIRTPDDALAAIPVILGFEPRESIAMLTFGGRETFHARVDLPPPERPHELREAIGLVVEPAVRHGVTSVLLVVYSEHTQLARRASRALRDAFAAEDIAVVERLWADGQRWHADGRRGEPGQGVSYDAVGHRFRAESVFRGHVVHRSRAQLARLLDSQPAAVAAVAAQVSGAAGLAPEAVAALVASQLGPGRFGDADLAAILRALRGPEARDAAWAAMTRADAESHVRLWTDAVQRAPGDLVAAPAALLALAAWLAGHGALAWCAVDRSQAAEPDGSLARLVGDLLAGAVPPTGLGGAAGEP